ncbi:hypothetical protein [Qipengyuania nanhaisediminis]|uniref:hypothetical protein n=1 Tax=Qipengyuania nanhaisediminis TaxID=604088 RepID=UPI001FDF3B66|nr:hypothetical protein [Qipengyuania nanhaisediminis]
MDSRFADPTDWNGWNTVLGQNFRGPVDRLVQSLDFGLPKAPAEQAADKIEYRFAVHFSRTSQIGEAEGLGRFQPSRKIASEALSQCRTNTAAKIKGARISPDAHSVITAL